MSTIKTILVPVGDATSAAASLETALRLAGPSAAHVTALHVRPDPTAAVPLVGEGMSGSMVEEMLAAAEKQAASIATATRAVFDQVCAKLGVTAQATPPAATVTAHWLDVVGREEELVARKGRVHDLVVMSHPGPQTDDSSGLTLNAALLESGKPLVLAPATAPTVIGKRVAIAWNGSAEAARAVAAALPLMTGAELVTVLTANENDSVAGAEELIGFLAWHGVRANHAEVPAGGNAGAALLEAGRLTGMDLLVMGAYTHSRLRQLILGGVTRHVMSHAHVPVLMSH